MNGAGFFSTRRRVVGVLLPVYLAIAVGMSAIAGCGSMWDHLLGPLHEGAHRIQATTAADVQRSEDVRGCLEAWARTHGHPGADYQDVDFSKLIIVRVAGDGVIGYYNGSSFQTDERQAGDTVLINEGVSGSEFVALERHAAVHKVQSQHAELIGADGTIHWPPPWDGCRVPRAIVGS